MWSRVNLEGSHETDNELSLAAFLYIRRNQIPFAMNHKVSPYLCYMKFWKVASPKLGIMFPTNKLFKLHRSKSLMGLSQLFFFLINVICNYSVMILSVQELHAIRILVSFNLYLDLK